jgi:hypothetical protein
LSPAKIIVILKQRFKVMANLNSDALLDIALKADVETLYAAIGQAASRSRLDVAPKDKQSLIEVGRKWLNNKHNELQKLVCNSPEVTQLFLSNDPRMTDARDLVLLVADLIVSACSGIPVNYVAALIVKLGLREWCKED